jgi:activator of Hsp90 ATPase-like protein
LRSGRSRRLSQPYRRLSYTWHTFTPEWREIAREKVGFEEEFLDRIAAEPRSKATFELEDLGELVKLTVIHDGFEPGSEVLPTISQDGPTSSPTSRPCSRPASFYPHQRRHRRSRPPPEGARPRVLSRTGAGQKHTSNRNR